MATPRVLILRAPGANCDLETQFAFEQAGALADRIHIQRLREQPKLLLQYQVLVIPGGYAPDHIRRCEAMIRLTSTMAEQGKPIAAICHGPWTLIDAGGVKGKRMTSWPSLKTDLSNAGANWVDEQVVTDVALVTSRKPDDLPAFNKMIIDEFREACHARSSAG